MRYRIALIGLAAVALVAVTYIVAGSLLHPRAQKTDSQIRIDFDRAKPANDLVISPGVTGDIAEGEIETLAARPMLFIDGRVNVSKGSSTPSLQAAYKKIRAFMSAHHLESAGAPFAINEDFDTAKQVWSYRAGIPLKSAPQTPPGAADGISLGKTYGGAVARFVHLGDPNQAQSTYAKVDTWMHANKFTAAGPSWEEYLSDPRSPVSQWRTNIYIPLG